MICEHEIEKNKKLSRSIISLAWHTEAFARHKRLPRLETVIKDMESDGKHSKADAILIAMAKEKGVIIK